MNKHRLFRPSKPFSPLRIGLDIDGVLSDFTTPYLAKLIEFNGSIPDRVKEWNPLVDPNKWSWERDYGFKQKDIEKFWSWCKTDEGQREFWGKMPPLLDFLERGYVQQLCADNDVYFITTRPFMTKKVVEKWIDYWYSASFNGRPPTVLLSEKRKGDLAAGLHLHAMFDDKPFNVQTVLRSCGTSCIPFLISQPWNKDFDDPYIVRVDSIKEGMTLLEETIKCQQ